MVVVIYRQQQGIYADKAAIFIEIYTNQISSSHEFTVWCLCDGHKCSSKPFIPEKLQLERAIGGVGGALIVCLSPKVIGYNDGQTDQQIGRKLHITKNYLIDINYEKAEY